MQNPFENRALSLSGPARDYVPVTPSDSNPLPQVAIALYAEVGGRVTFISETGAMRDVEIPDFGWIMCGVSHVRATGTTATGLHALVLF
jgi:hypothetical protein